jgi:hypothetical protein
MGRLCHLRDGVHLAVVGEDLVSLDVHADAYGCLRGLAAAVGPLTADGQIELSRADAAESLGAAGLLSSAARDVKMSKPRPPHPVRSAWRTETVTTSAADWRRLARAGLWAMPRYWFGSFETLASSAARARPQRPESAVAAVARDARAFDQLTPFVPFQGECLFRSFLLLAFLRAGGGDADWVIGVRTYPFEAHCWLQVGDIVLDDAPERVCGFMPILVI